MKPSIKVTSDFTDQVNKILSKFKRDAVLVGVPETDTKRKEDEPINNATILAMNQFGVDELNIPPRPIMSIGIKNAQEEISEQFKLAAKNALFDGPSALTTYYNRAGIIASNSIKKVINSQEGIEAPAESTLEARREKGFKGEKALLVTGQLRNSITYVVNDG